MIDKILLDKSLSFYSKQGKQLRPINFNKKLIDNLFEEFNNYGMTENSYCCYGEKTCCWQEVIEEGIWDLTLEDVKKDIKRDINYAKRYLYNNKKFGKRFYIYKDEQCCIIYIYTRDLLCCDYSIWFCNDSECESLL